MDSKHWCTIPVHPADKNFVGEPHSSPELETGVRDLPAQPPSFQLHHRGKLGHITNKNIKLNQKIILSGFHKRKDQ